MTRALAFAVGFLGLAIPCLSSDTTLLLCGSESQQPCSAGCYFNKGVCETVPPGHSSPDNSNRIFKCRSGHFSAGQAEFCTPCPPGQFAESIGSPTCYPCGIAQYNPYAGSRRCRACNPARYIGYGSLEVEEAEGIVFCVEPKDTIPPTWFGNWTLRPSASPTPAASSEAPQIEASPSEQPIEEPTGIPSFINEEPTSGPSLTTTEDPTNDPSSSEPSFRRKASTAPSQTPYSSFHPSVTSITQSPSDQHIHALEKKFEVWKVLLPNFGAAFIITCFAWLLVQKSPNEKSPLHSTGTGTADAKADDEEEHTATNTSMTRSA